MIDTSRRGLLTTLIAGAASAPLSIATPATAAEGCAPQPHWGKGVEGQRIADLGNGTYLNPIVPGDHPDPTILKDGDDYYMTFSSFYSYPGLIIWHSTDLVNWAPVGPALKKTLGTIWAVDLCKHNGRYFIYIPAAPDEGAWSIYAIWADDIRGPWSDPVDLNIHGCIDPGHVVGEDGKRYLFVNGIRRVRLSDDGLAKAGEVEPAYTPWHYPDDWITENFAAEGPKLMRRGDYFYLTTAVGGTAGPVTGHMVIVARSKSIDGPWEDCPYNPIVRTLSTAEPWWSRGHATPIQGPAGDWWIVYHGYENSFRTLGRQTLLQPISWTKDGWFKAEGGDLSRPLAKPKGGKAGPAGFALSDDFSKDRFGIQWCFHDPKPDEMTRVAFEPSGMRLAARGTSPADTAVLTCAMRDRSYEVEITLDRTAGTEAGLLLYYNPKAFVGLGLAGDVLKTWQYAEEQAWSRTTVAKTAMRLKITNQDNVITWHYSADDGRTWTRHPTRMEVSGLNHNVFGGFLSLKVGIYCVNGGSVLLKNFTYRALS